jgi:hypothetical protein
MAQPQLLILQCTSPYISKLTYNPPAREVTAHGTDGKKLVLRNMSHTEFLAMPTGMLLASWLAEELHRRKETHG